MMMKRFFRKSLSLFTHGRNEEDSRAEMTVHLSMLEEEHCRRGLVAGRGTAGRATRDG